MFEGEFCEEAARQRGYRMPLTSGYEEGTNSGMWLTVADPDAAVAVPGVVQSSAEKVAGAGRSDVQVDAFLSGEAFATRLGHCSFSSSDTQELVDNARRFSERFAVEAGSPCCSSRLAVPNAHAAWFLCDVPQRTSSPEWYLFWASSDLRLPTERRAQPYRCAGRALSC